MRRHVLLMLLCLMLAAPAAAAAAKTSWAQREIRVVTLRGLMGGKAASFRPDAPLTQAALAELAADLTERPAAAPTDPAAPVTMAKLDSVLVAAIGLRTDATAFATAAKAAGLAPPSRFGTEVVARLMGLRTNHPAGQDALELLPNDTATRAEAAFSAAQIIGLGDWELQSVDDAAQTFEVPDLTFWQRRILRVAVSFIGYPYVWGGTSENAQTPLGVSTPGGFDCSGFVWRVYKLQSYAAASQLSGVLRGRTTMTMRREVKAGSGRSHRDLPRRRLVHPLVRIRRRTRATRRLVRVELRVGTASLERGEAQLEPRSPVVVISTAATTKDNRDVSIVPRPQRKGSNASVETTLLRSAHACGSRGGRVRRLRRRCRRHAPAVRLVEQAR